MVFFYQIVVLVNMYQIKQRISDYFEECFIDIQIIFNNLLVLSADQDFPEFPCRAW